MAHCGGPNVRNQRHNGHYHCQSPYLGFVSEEESISYDSAACAISDNAMNGRKESLSLVSISRCWFLEGCSGYMTLIEKPRPRLETKRDEEAGALTGFDQGLDRAGLDTVSRDADNGS